MLNFITENYGNMIVGLVVLAIVVCVAVKLIKDKKDHKSSCSCGCNCCPGSGMCHGAPSPCCGEHKASEIHIRRVPKSR